MPTNCHERTRPRPNPACGFNDPVFTPPNHSPAVGTQSFHLAARFDEVPLSGFIRTRPGWFLRRIPGGHTEFRRDAECADIVELHLQLLKGSHGKPDSASSRTAPIPATTSAWHTARYSRTSSLVYGSPISVSYAAATRRGPRCS